jgi:FkbM family methyltransferase
MKRVVKRAARALGLEIRRTLPYEPYQWIAQSNIRTVLDVGANTGEFAAHMQRLLPESRIYSFEPLAVCYRKLTERMNGCPGFKAFPYALGDANGTATIHHNAFAPSSSLLPMEQLHREAFPFSGETVDERIEIRRLDDVVSDREVIRDLLVKIDVQGFEDKVIRGGERVISQASILVVETSFLPLYVGQLLFDPLYDLLRGHGFVFVGCEEAIRDPRNGTILQADSIFMKDPHRTASR